MKKGSTILIVVLGLAVIVEGFLLFRKYTEKPDKALTSFRVSAARAPLADEMDSVSYAIGVNMGYLLQEQFNGKEYDFDIPFVVAGMADYVGKFKSASAAGEFDPGDPDFRALFRINLNEESPVSVFFQRKQSEARAAARSEMARIAAENETAGREFLAENAKKEGVQVSESGLQYIILNKGNAKRAGENAKVNVRYKGTFIDGSVFDDSGEESVEFNRSEVIAGFSEGLSLVGEGGHIMLFVPPALGYGEGNAMIPPQSTLIFDVTLVSIGK